MDERAAVLDIRRSTIHQLCWRSLLHLVASDGSSEPSPTSLKNPTRFLTCIVHSAEHSTCCCAHMPGDTGRLWTGPPPPAAALHHPLASLPTAVLIPSPASQLPFTIIPEAAVVLARRTCSRSSVLMGDAACSVRISSVGTLLGGIQRPGSSVP